MVDVATVNPVTTTAQPAGAINPSNIDAVFGALLQEIADAAQNAQVSAPGADSTSLIGSGANPAASSGASIAPQAISLANLSSILGSNFASTVANSATGPGADAAAISNDVLALLANKGAWTPQTGSTASQTNSASAANSAVGKSSDLEALLAQLGLLANAGKTNSAPTSLDDSGSAQNQPVPEKQADSTKTSDSGQSSTSENQNSAAEALLALLLPQTTQTIQPMPAQTNTANASTATAPATTAPTPPQPSIGAAQQPVQPADTNNAGAASQNTSALANNAATAAIAEPQIPYTPAQAAAAVADTNSPKQAVPQPAATPAQPQAATPSKSQSAAPAPTDPSATPQPPTGLKAAAANASSEDASNSASDNTVNKKQDDSTSAPTAAAVPDQVPQPNPTQTAIPLAAVPPPQVPPTQVDEGKAATVAAEANQTVIAPAGLETKTKSNQETKTRLGLADKAASSEKPGTAESSAKSSKADDKNLESGLKQPAGQTHTAANDPAPAQPDASRVAVPEKPAVVQPAPAAHSAQPDANPQQSNAPLSPVDSSKVTAQVQVASQHHDSDTPTTFDKLGVAIAARSIEGLHQFDIRLDPQDLGRVHVHLTVDDAGQAQANLVVDKPQTLDLLQRDASSLNRALQDAGLILSNNGLSFSLREQYRQNENSNEGRGRSLSAKAVLAADASQSRSSLGSYAPNSVRLDIRV